MEGLTAAGQGRGVVRFEGDGPAELSFRASITDNQGNRSSVTVYDAYFGN